MAAKPLAFGLFAFVMTRWSICGAAALALLAACGEPPSTTPAPVAPAAAPAPTPLVDVPALAEQAPSVVAQQLGDPTGCESIKYGEKCTYRNKTEVVFINGLADWITVHADLPYSEEALPLMGFKPAPSSFDNEYVIRWSGEQGTLLIQLAPGSGGRAFFAYVKVRTP
ncbi:MAG: hypothetical protein Q7J58_17570 [Hydrogenophaga sp.]|uniref:hypothetical protein n=1 Tax=Hydrogenophaga sp. TaxID=1904254 RepID=UPI00271BBBEC|nr:hypothetical protein [Hydrogenophaga sp.]MDO9571162.1 hypothetical protein [Hydrogenophaga sp.]